MKLESEKENIEPDHGNKGSNLEESEKTAQQPVKIEKSENVIMSADATVQQQTNDSGAKWFRTGMTQQENALRLKDSLDTKRMSSQSSELGKPDILAKVDNIKLFESTPVKSA